MFDLSNNIAGTLEDGPFEPPCTDRELPSEFLTYVKKEFSDIRLLASSKWEPLSGENDWWRRTDGYPEALVGDFPDAWYIPESSARVDYQYENVLYDDDVYIAYMYDGFDADAMPASFIYLTNQSDGNSYIVETLEWRLDEYGDWLANYV